MTPDLLRPRQAAQRIGVSRQTLARWADAGLIGSVKVGRVRLYRASDLADLLAAHETRRTVVPVRTPAGADAQPTDWREDPFWRRQPSVPAARKKEARSRG